MCEDHYHGSDPGTQGSGSQMRPMQQGEFSRACDATPVSWNARKLSILMISQMVPYLPSYDGFRLIPANLIRELSKRHSVHLVALSEGREEQAQLDWPLNYCASVRIVRSNGGRRPLTPGLLEAVRQSLDTVGPDVLHIEGPALAPAASLVHSPLVTILSAHDSLSLRYRHFSRFGHSRKARALSKLRALLARRFERRWFSRVDRVVVTSSSDREALARHIPPERLNVIPNGVDLKHWSYRPKPVRGRLVFTGNMSWPPNEDAARFFATEVFPLIRKSWADAEFWIVGAAPSAEVEALTRIPGVHVTGTVPDLRDWIASAVVYVSPLRFGAGVKNKILEAMAIGAPIVATPQSLTGTPLQHRRHLLIAETPFEFAENVLDLLRNIELRSSLSTEARKEVELHYSWDSIADMFELLYRSVGAKGC